MSYAPFGYPYIIPPTSGWSWTNQGPATTSVNVTKDQGSLYLRSGTTAPR